MRHTRRVWDEGRVIRRRGPAGFISNKRFTLKRAGVAICCLIAFASSTRLARATALPWIKTSGSQFVLPSGKQIVLRGFVTLTGATNYYWYSLHDYQRMAALGANYQSIRVAIGALGYTSPSSSYLSQLKQMVAFAAQAGIYSDFKVTDIDIHPAFDWTAFWKNPAGQQQKYIQALVGLAKAFAGNPAVVGYDILNEPHQGTLGVTPSTFASKYLNPFYVNAITSMRQVDPGHIVFFQPEDERGQGDLPYVIPLQASQIAYAPHFYPPHPMFSTAAYLPLLQRYVHEAAASSAPLMIGEFGSPWNIALDGDAPLEAQYQTLEGETYAFFARYNASYSRPWWSTERNTTPGPNGSLFTWSTVLGTTKNLNGPFRTWVTVPFQRAAAAGPP